MTVIRGVGFDLDGTLFDHRGSATDGVTALFRFLGVAPSDAAFALWFSAEEEGFDRWRSGQLSHQQQRRFRLKTVLPALGVALPDGSAALDSLFEEYLREYRAAWRAYPDAAGALASLRGDGMRVGILTNGSQDQQIAKLRAIGLYDLVDVVCTAEALGVWKPDARAFHAFAGQLGVSPAECLFVGDHPEQDVAGAVAAGMPALLVDHYGDQAEGLAAVVGRTHFLR